MTTCKGCDGEFGVEELRRHEDEGIVRVHCPTCGRMLGTYNRHASR